MPPFVSIGRIVRTHGLKGEVAVSLAADLPFESLTELDVWLVPPPEALRHTSIDAVRAGPKGPLVTLRGVDDVSAARALVGTVILTRATDVPSWPAADRPRDVVGLRVIDEERGLLGTVEDVIVTGANDVWVVRGEVHGEILLPVIDEVILSLDDDSRVATVRLLPGLLPEGPPQGRD